MEGGKSPKSDVGADDVVVFIPNPQELPKLNKSTVGSTSLAYSDTIKLDPSKMEFREQANSGGQSTPQMNPPPPGETSIRRRPLTPSRRLKPKSRLMEPPPPRNLKLVEEKIRQYAPSGSPYRSPMRMASPASVDNRRTTTAGSITPRTPLMASPGYADEDDYDDDVYQPGFIPGQFENEKHGRKVKFVILIEWIAFFCILGFLIVSLTVDNLSTIYVSGLRIWRWCSLLLVILCGHLITEWLTDLLVFVIEKNYLLKNKVLYFLYNLRKCFQVSLWLGLILLAWALLINRGVKRSTRTMRILNYITRGIASSLIGSVMWMVKTLLVKLLASSFHVQAYFDKIQDTVFHQYVLQTLSGPALTEKSLKNSGRLSFKYSMKGNQKGKGDEVVDVDKLFRLTKEKISSWAMGGLVQVIRTSGLSTISEALDRSDDDEGTEQKEITSEYEAKAAAKRIFKRVATSGKEYIDEEDLSRFFPPEEVDDVILMFGGASQNGQIRKSSFKRWVIKVYHERKYLAHSLNDAKTAIEELNKIASAMVLVIIIIVWLLLMGFATTKVLVFISSQILVLVFIFGNTAKTVFEALVFVFVTHPFDVGDKCVVEGVQMVVEEMNILTTIFLRYDNQMIYYPNCVLATKPIANFARSPPLCDSVEFSVDFSTSVESIAGLKDRIKRYLESNPQNWQPSHSVVIKEIEVMDKLKMGLSVTHATNSADTSGHRSDLIMELKKFFEELDIKYHLLQQEVLVRYVG